MQLVLLHAFPLDERMWAGQRALLPGRTIAPCLYDLGETMEEWAAAVLSTADEGPLIVVGASMGGSCALEMARQAGERIGALVLVGAKAGHNPEPELRDCYLASLEADGVTGIWPEVRTQGLGQDADAEIVQQVQAMATEQRIADLVRAVQVFHGRPDLTGVVGSWRKPLVAVCGTDGELESEERGRKLAALAPMGRLHVMRGCGHYMSLERPAEFNEVLRGVLAAVDVS